MIDDRLAATWRLKSWEREWFDDREGHGCNGCGMSKRVRMIVWAIRWLKINLADMDVLHINQVNNLSSGLESARSICSTLYAPGEQPEKRDGGLVHQDISNLTFADNTFDLVIHSETLEHVFDPQKALSEVQRVLRPGGFNIYTVPLLHYRMTLQRAFLDGAGSVVDLHPPSHHGLEGEDGVVWEFGGDFISSRADLIHRICYDDFFANPTVFAVIERARN